ncbi:ABC transporter ATP-binding protein [Candidatus Bathyarchaeota archaeon]|nr:MAG: ABC transporter ATP-binding protein [Candidatus Bathyarchaeota archaeon]
MSVHIHLHRRGRSRNKKSDDENLERSLPDSMLFRRLLKYVFRYKTRLILLIVALISITLTSMMQPYITQLMIDKYLISSSELGLSIDEKIAGITVYCLIFLVLAIINWLATAGQTFLLNWLGHKVVYDIRNKLMKHLQELSVRFFAEGETGDIMSRITNDVEALGDVFLRMLPTSITSIISMIGYIIIMFTWNVKLTLITLAALLLFILPVFIFHSKSGQAFMRTRRGIARVTTRLEESVSGIRVIQSLTREGQTSQEFDKVNVENLQANISASFLMASFNAGIQIIIAIVTCIVLWFSVNEVILGTISVGIVFGFTLYLMKVFQPISEIAMFYNDYQSAMASMERIVELEDAPIEVQENETKIEISHIKGIIEYKDVTFGYDPKVHVLKNINLKVDQNETIALVGHTGAGKSSMIKLLSRFYDPQEGAIYIDGHDIKDLSFKSLRQSMGIVLQDTFLFPTTIRENIRYGRMEATDEDVIKASKSVNAHSFIERLPEGYDTIIREGSSNISVGQRQLISFARALLVDPRIIILDEATSSVDPYTELIIQQGLEHLLSNRTAFVIAHRLSTVRSADRIIVLKEGEIAEEGTHKELMKKDGIYRQLYLMQFREPTTEVLLD